jgi:hypothetical protein
VHADGIDGGNRHLDVGIVDQRAQLAIECVGQHRHQPRRFEPGAATLVAGSLDHLRQ